MMFLYRPVSFKQKCMPVPFYRKMGIEQEAEQATNGVTDYVNRTGALWPA